MLSTGNGVAVDGGAPLYGRATRVLHLGPMSFIEAYPFLATARNPAEAFQFYAVFGGTRYYLSLLEPSRGLEHNIERLVLSPGAPPDDEPARILLAEVREPNRYHAVLEAIAQGATRITEIASKTGIATTSLPRYSRVPQSMDLTGHVKPPREAGGYTVSPTTSPGSGIATWPRGFISSS